MNEKVYVESSNIKFMYYESDNKTLDVGFNNGTVYQYFSVPLEVYEDFRKAESKGKFFYKNIRGVFKFKKYEKEE
jgi:hypothetical protein